MASVVGHGPPPFFKRGPAPLARLFFFLIVCLVLLIADLRYRYLETLRQAIAVVAYPIQAAAYAPVDVARSVSDYFSSVRSLTESNAELVRKQVEVAGRLLRQDGIEQENARLRALLDLKARQPSSGVVAEILYNTRDVFSRRVIIDKGTQHGIATGQAVIDDAGVIGQVTRVYPLQAEVTLLTDKDQAVPVQITRNGLRAVMFGAGNGQLELRFLAANADVQVGDAVVTSGLDGIFLPGLPVAKVMRIDRDSSYSFARILCQPAAGIEQHGTALVLASREALPVVPDQAPVRDAPAKAKRGRR
ncbi:MAG TPA: rod shape-determining protein MreC [Rhodocyclaceae bacterium]|nr:rod shape-determining protein MreC [Rhodocyclaceae bacterium]HMZ82815.1 rod shape-determining protein MreC [Rhodocyclaceae bacterium]HNB79839.1 rod shape-determining protein MreC [Rhodocyclaceae bacterium]HNC62703.1 rod shape-determining protein MreC [Rhodocyclaceae bacterium]HNH13453.1 rod shape-determining protein MreC [Rhodocyclaceae bacterium]